MDELGQSGLRPLRHLGNRTATSWPDSCPGAGRVVLGSPCGPAPRLFSGGSTNRVANRAGMWKQDESGRVHTPLEPVVLAATLALIPVLIIEADATSRWWQQFATVANWIIWAVFAVELAAVLIFAPRNGPLCSAPTTYRPPRGRTR